MNPGYMEQLSTLRRCFEKHSFHELNNIDKISLSQAVGKVLLKDRPQHPVFFDVGTNAGSFIAAVKEFNIPYTAHCFEPHPILAQTVKSKYPNIILNECCVSNTSGDIIIHIRMWSCGISSIINRPVFAGLNQEIVKYNTKSVTLDEYCRSNNIDTIDFIKVDVEGAEKMVFDGAKELLAQKRIKAGIFEIGQTLVDAGTTTEELCTLIKSYGYTLDTSVSQNDIMFYL